MEIPATTSEFQRSLTPRAPSTTTSAELSAALRHDRAELHRGVLAWQLNFRFAIAAAIAAAAALFSHLPRSEVLLPVASVVGLHAMATRLVTAIARRGAVRAHYRWHASVLVALDVLSVSALLHVTASPAHADRVLVATVGIAALGVHYFGRAVGATAAITGAVAYILIAGLAAPDGTGVRPSPLSIAFDVTLFAIVAAPVVHALGRTRERLDRLRVFCGLASESGRTAVESLGSDPRPDELTLMTRALDRMRNRLLAQIGTDPLTGCLNRRALGARLQTEWRLAKRRASSLAILVIDVDHFKGINDGHGHPVGDEVLKDVARIMRRAKRDSDVAARVGGDEFVMLLPDASLDGAERLAGRIAAQLAEHRFAPPIAHLTVTLSIGVAMAHGSEEIDAEVLFERGDHALYRAKADGRNRIVA